MMLLLCLLAAALGAVSPSDETGNCPEFWQSFNGRCYKYMATPMNWADAEIFCVSQGANLVSIHNDEENGFVKTLVKNFDANEQHTWIGLNDQYRESAWMWSDGCPVKYTPWSVGQPDNKLGKEHCGHINYGSDQRWNDAPCNLTFNIVCGSRTMCSQSV